MDLKQYLEVKGKDKMAIKDKQAFLTNHLLAFGIAGDEPITNTLKLNEAGIIVDHANPEAQQTWTYEDSKLTIFDEDHETIATFDIKQDENGSLVASSGSMIFLESEVLTLTYSDYETYFQTITGKTYTYTNPQAEVYSENIILNKDLTISTENDLLEQYWAIDDNSIIFYNQTMSKITEIAIEQFEGDRLLIMG